MNSVENRTYPFRNSEIFQAIQIYLKSLRAEREKKAVAQILTGLVSVVRAFLQITRRAIYAATVIKELLRSVDRLAKLPRLGVAIR